MHTPHELPPALPFAPGDLTYKHLIELEALHCLEDDTLRRFLEPYTAWCRAVGIRLDRRFTDRGRRRLHQALWAEDVHRPDELSQALVDLGDLAGEWGFEATVQEALNTWRAGKLDPARNPVELAFREYLLRNSQEMSALARSVHGKGVPRVMEYAPREPAPLERHRSEVHLDSFKEVVGVWFDDRGRTNFSDVLCDESTREVQFRVTRGMVPRTQPIVVDGARVERIDFVPARPDLIIFDKRTSILSVNAQLPVEHDGYRRMFGRVFFDSPDHFAVNELYTGAPLIADAEAALCTDGFPAIRDVSLREVRFDLQPRLQRASFVGDRINDAVPALVDMMRATSGHVSIRHLRLALYLSARKRPTIVEISQPNRCKVDRRFAGDIVREFLLARGFLRLPQLESEAAAA